MYNRFLNIIFIFFTSTLFSQENLIQNGSFEDIDSCYGDPAALGFDVFKWSGCKGWSNPAYSSSDLWCENPVFGNNEPPNIIGFAYQEAHSGENFADIIVLDNNSWNYREYVQNELITNLEKDQIYQFEFYVNTAAIKNQTSCLDAFFSSKKIQSTEKRLNLVPQIKNNIDNFFNDSLGWYHYKKFYKGDGKEKFIIIGCFDDSSNIQIFDHDIWLAEGIILFLDDFSLTKAPYFFSIPNVFTLNNDGINDFFSPNVINLNWNCKIFNRWGNEILELNNESPNWDGKNCKEGTYFYAFEGKDKENIFKESGFIQLLRE